MCKLPVKQGRFAAGDLLFFRWVVLSFPHAVLAYENQQPKTLGIIARNSSRTLRRPYSEPASTLNSAGVIAGGIGAFAEDSQRISKCVFFLGEFFGTANDISKLVVHEHRQLYFELLPFCLAVCGALGEGENELTALAAFWLGLVDTVRADVAVA
jgi:hypothetical protein